MSQENPSIVVKNDSILKVKAKAQDGVLILLESGYEVKPTPSAPGEQPPGTGGGATGGEATERTERFSFFIAKEELGTPAIARDFGPQQDGSLNISLVLNVRQGASVKAPFDCEIALVKPYANSDERLLCLRLIDSEILKQVGENRYIVEIPAYFIFKSNEINFKGLDESFLENNPRRGSRDAAAFLADVSSGKESLYFKCGQEIGETADGVLSMSILTTAQIRPRLKEASLSSYQWLADVECRNYADPVSFWHGLIKAHESGVAELFVDDVQLAEAKYLFDSETLTPQRIIVEVRDEYNSPLLESDPNASGVRLHSLPAPFMKEGTPALDLLVSDFRAGFGRIDGALTSFGFETAMPTMAAYSIMAEQFVFWDFTQSKSYIRRSSEGTAPVGIELRAPAHYVIQALRPADWFAPQEAQAAEEELIAYPEAYRPLNWYTTGNHVVALIDGMEYFESLHGVLSSIDNAVTEHFIHIAGWSMDVEFNFMTPPYSGIARSLKDMFQPILDKVRVLLWDNVCPPLPRVSYNNMPALDFINGFQYDEPGIDEPTQIPCKALLDTRQDLASLSANHMKLCAAGFGVENEVVAYCGGIDIWPDRVTDGRHLNSKVAGAGADGQHDTMMKVQGEAAYELNRVMYKRWIDAKINNIPPRTPVKAEFLCPPYAGSNEEGSVIAQIACTIDGRPTPPYAFAVNGDVTILSTLKKAINRARQYIYIEDQYFRAPVIVAELEKAVQRGVAVILLMPKIMWDSLVPWLPELPDDDSILPPGTAKEQTETLRNNYPDLFGAYYPEGPAGEIYVHSKLWIIDDIFVSCGSANMDRKGLGSEPLAATSCECNGFYIDAEVNNQGSRTFARDLRIRLWSEHLFQKIIPPDVQVENYGQEFAALVDPLKAFKERWKNLQPGDRIRALT